MQVMALPHEFYQIGCFKCSGAGLVSSKRSDRLTSGYSRARRRLARRPVEFTGNGVVSIATHPAGLDMPRTCTSPIVGSHVFRSEIDVRAERGREILDAQIPDDADARGGPLSCHRNSHARRICHRPTGVAVSAQDAKPPGHLNMTNVTKPAAHETILKLRQPRIRRPIAD